MIDREILWMHGSILQKKNVKRAFLFEIESQQEFVLDELFVYHGKVIIIFIKKL